MKELLDIKKQYENSGIEFPTAIQLEYECRLFIENTWRTLNKYANGNAVPKSGWIWMDELSEKQITDNVPEKYMAQVEIIVKEIKKLNNDLLTEEGLVLEDGYTLSKKGRKRLRQTCDIIGKLLVRKIPTD